MTPQQSPDELAPAVLHDLVLVARTLRLDREAGVAVGCLRTAGIPSILLKGATIATWLYDDGEVRPYCDIDLLVPPHQLDDAKTALATLGYAHRLSGADPIEFGPKEQELYGPDDVCIDLHHGLIGATAPNQRCWEVLARHTVPFELPNGAQVEVLAVPARAMHLALHAAQNGPIDQKAIADLERGLAVVDVDVWRQAAAIASELGAARAFAAGLRLVPRGARLADELSLTRRMTVELALRTTSAPQDAIFFERLGEAVGARKKIALLARKLFPTPTYLRANSEIASRGPVGLVLACLWHPVSLAARLRPALLAWIEAKRSTKTSS